MQTIGSVAAVIAAIGEDAAAEVERIEQLPLDVGAPPEPPRRDEERVNAIRRENAERIARQEWEGARAAIEQREAWIRRVVEHAALSADPMPLVLEALRYVPGEECEIALNPGDRIDVSRLGRRVRVVEGPIAGGCIVTAGDTSFDNSYEARARRLESEWRNALSGMYRP